MNVAAFFVAESEEFYSKEVALAYHTIGMKMGQNDHP